MEKKESSANRHERRNHSISLERFGQQRGQVRALEEFRNRKNKKRLETARALRMYKKTMKMEGFEAGKGAARKRNAPDKDGADHVNDNENSSRPLKRHKSNAMQKSIDKAMKQKEEKEELKKSMEESRNEREKKLKERKKMSRLLAKRTKRGQPIIKHTVENLLRKLEQG
jgi:hypothetical protein